MSKKFPRKILYSPSYGAGWASWADDNIAQFVAEYKPIIDFIESGGEFPQTREEIEKHNLIIQLHKDLVEEFADGETDFYFYTGGARDLKVATVYEPYRIDEYDGFESIKTIADTDFFY